MTMSKRVADITHPCLTPVFTSNLRSLWSMLHVNEISVEIPDDIDYLERNSVCSETSTETVPVDAIKGFLKVYEVDVQLVFAILNAAP